MAKPIEDVELIVLGWVGNDYESLHTIERNVSDDIGRQVPHDGLHRTIEGLSDRGLVDSYPYHPAIGNYEKCRIRASNRNLSMKIGHLDTEFSV